MPEILLHYIWQQGLFLDFPQRTTTGQPIEVFSFGKHNLNAGPDFTDVRLRMNGLEMVGQIELHVESSDWYRHRHHLDPAYDHILLHVVRHADKAVVNSRGEEIPQLELNYPAPQDYLDRLLHDAYAMDSAVATHRCAQRLLAEPSLITDGWKQTMLLRRLRCKQESINRLLQISHNDWQQAFYVSLAHAFGFHTNGVPMEMVALATPLSVIFKHRDNLTQLQALLLGQAGLLTEDDPLYKEYAFLRTKFSLTSINPSLWKQGRIRPQTRPSVRLMQFAQLLHTFDSPFSLCLIDNPTVQQTMHAIGLGQRSIDGLLINVVAPFLFARGLPDEALALLNQLPAEDNRVIRQWRTLGQIVTSAADTQALLHLYLTCCEPGRCTTCAVWSDRANETTNEQ
ncbi:MAG: DUF2851 family protein [Paludibacteraceae bacterium]|nr:DUF2851 family protein [Paludibacteraceae bacterium]